MNEYFKDRRRLTMNFWSPFGSDLGLCYCFERNGLNFISNQKSNFFDKDFDAVPFDHIYYSILGDIYHQCHLVVNKDCSYPGCARFTNGHKFVLGMLLAFC